MKGAIVLSFYRCTVTGGCWLWSHRSASENFFSWKLDRNDIMWTSCWRQLGMMRSTQRKQVSIWESLQNAAAVKPWCLDTEILAITTWMSLNYFGFWVNSSELIHKVVCVTQYFRFSCCSESRISYSVVSFSKTGREGVNCEMVFKGFIKHSVYGAEEFKILLLDRCLAVFGLYICHTIWLRLKACLLHC